MSTNDIHSIYDQLCFILTDYEEDDGSSGTAGENLYYALVDIVNEFAEKLN